MTPEESARAAARLVQAQDPARFAAAMAAPVAARNGLMALYALNLELARAPWASAEPMIAEMRVQWWVDTLEALCAEGRAPSHEIGPALAAVARGVDLSPMIAAAEARRWDCWREPFADDAALEAYLQATSGSLYQVAAVLLGASPDGSQAAADFGTAAGMAAFFRAIPELEARGRLPLPDGRPTAVSDLAARGLAALARARSRRWSLPRGVWPAFLPGAETEAILRQALDEPSRVAQGALGLSEFARRARLAWIALTGRW